MKPKTSVLLSCLLAFCLVVPAQAGDPPEQKAEDPMTAAMMAAATPGENHAKLVEMCGEYEVTGKMWMDPAAEPMTTAGKSAMKSVLDGRYVVEKSAMGSDGMKMEGMGITGYDNIAGRFFSTWIDNMSTGMFQVAGDYDEQGRMVMTGAYKNPLDGQDVPCRLVTSYPDPDTHVMEMFENRGGEEMRTMELTYKRVR